MRMIEFDLHPNRRQLQQFAVAAIVACALLAASVQWRGHLLFWELRDSHFEALIVLAAVAAYAALSALVAPRAIWPVYLALTLVAIPVGTALGYVLLTLFFYGLITPVGLWFRIRRRDLLDRRGGRGRESYWRPARRDRSVSRYFRQF